MLSSETKNSPMDWKSLLKGSPDIVLGIDEVGYGALAGPLVVSVVAVPLDWTLEGLRDSKKLFHKKRERLDKHIRDHVVLEGICSSEEVDKMGGFLALQFLHRQAIKEARMVFPDAPIFIDGNLPIDGAISIVKGDDIVPAIMAASVHAKVFRDSLMSGPISLKYPEYKFHFHKGYGTAAHYQAIEKHGICPEHRRTYLKFLNGEVIVPKAIRDNLRA